MTPYHCTHLEIESRNPHHGFWELVHTIRPVYVYTRIVKRSWLWFKLPKITKTLGGDPVDAYMAARKAAIKAAKNLRGEVRVLEYYEFGNLGPASTIIWKDGKFLDC